MSPLKIVLDLAGEIQLSWQRSPPCSRLL